MAKGTSRNGLRRWRAALAPVVLGGLTGLVVAVLVQRSGDEVSPHPPAPPAARPQPAPPPRQAARVVPAPPRSVAAAPARRLSAWQRNAVAAPVAAGRPMIAVIIDDMGVDRRRSARAIALPGPLTLAFLPYAQDLPQQTTAARRAGHELLVHFPMEPENGGVDPGPDVLRADLTPEEFARRLNRGLGRFDGYVGISNHMGSRFTADRPAMARLFAELGRRGLLFVDSRTTPHTVAPRLARETRLPFAQRSVFLDNENVSSEVRVRLAETERIARRNGQAIAIGHPRDATLAALAEWLPALAGRGFSLVPVSALVRARLIGAHTATEPGRDGG